MKRTECEISEDAHADLSQNSCDSCKCGARCIVPQDVDTIVHRAHVSAGVWDKGCGPHGH